MMKARFAFIGLAAGMLASCGSDDASSVDYHWRELPALPPNPSGGFGQIQPGLAGPIAGVSNGALIVGGGANFPEAMPWDGGAKVWHDQLFVLEDPDATGWTTAKGWTLPRPLGYGVSISTDDGVICIGGCDAEQCYAEVFHLE